MLNPDIFRSAPLIDLPPDVMLEPRFNDRIRLFEDGLLSSVYSSTYCKKMGLESSLRVVKRGLHKGVPFVIINPFHPIGYGRYHIQPLVLCYADDDMTSLGQFAIVEVSADYRAILDVCTAKSGFLHKTYFLDIIEKFWTLYYHSEFKPKVVSLMSKDVDRESYPELLSKYFTMADRDPLQPERIQMICDMASYIETSHDEGNLFHLYSAYCLFLDTFKNQQSIVELVYSSLCRGTLARNRRSTLKKLVNLDK